MTEDRGETERKILERLGVTQKSYSHLVKDKCAGCGSYIKPDIERYETIGNWCTNCNTKINASMEAKKIKDR